MTDATRATTTTNATRTRGTRLARSRPMVAILTAAAGLPLLTAGPALAGPTTGPGTGTGIQWQAPLTDTSWTYGNSLSYRADPRLSGGHMMTAQSTTPKTCRVAHDADGNPTGELTLVDVGLCSVTLHLDGDATHARSSPGTSTHAPPR